MPDPLLQILKICLLAIIALFFLRVLRAVWAEIKPPAPVLSGTPGGQDDRKGKARAGQAAGLRLSIVEPATAKGQTFDVTDEMTVGRAAGCGVPLADSTVSQLHARIFRSTDGRIWVEDLGSTNGTFVNRKKVSAPVPLRRGDRLQVGATVLEVAR